MPPLLSFLIEASMVQSGAILFAALVVGYVTGPFLKNIGLNTYLRIALYSLVGAAAGIKLRGSSSKQMAMLPVICNHSKH